jgi:cytosine/uracil/thiamine/allantoin permease
VNKHREKDQTVYLAIAALLFCLFAVFVITGNTGFLGKKVNFGRQPVGQVQQESVKGMLIDLQGTTDDGGAGDIKQLKKDAAGL